MKLVFTNLSGGSELGPRLKQLRDELLGLGRELGRGGVEGGKVFRGELDVEIFFHVTLKNMQDKTS